MLPEILGVWREDGGVSWVPLTPVTTFRDVAACVRDTGDPLPHLLEASPLGVRVVAGWERPLELLRLWDGLKDQVSYTASYSHKDDPTDPLSAFSKSSYLEEDEEDSDPISPWELYDLKDELKDLGPELRSPLSNGALTTSGYPQSGVGLAFNDPPLSRSLDDSDELVVVSSDGEADSSYNSHTHNHFGRPFFRHGGERLSNRYPGRPSQNWSSRQRRPSASSPFVRGRSQTSSLPLKSQELVHSPLHYSKQRYQFNLQNSRFNAEVDHRKRMLPVHTIENGSLNFLNGNMYKYNSIQDYNVAKENYMEKMQWNRNLSPVISKKQKLRSTEHKQPSANTGYVKVNGKSSRVQSSQGEPTRPSHAGRPSQSDIRRLLQNHFTNKAPQVKHVIEVHQSEAAPDTQSSYIKEANSHTRKNLNTSGRDLQIRNNSDYVGSSHGKSIVNCATSGESGSRTDPVSCGRESSVCTNYSPGHQSHGQAQVQEHDGQRHSTNHRSRGKKDGIEHHNKGIPGQWAGKGTSSHGQERRPHVRVLGEAGSSRETRQSQGGRSHSSVVEGEQLPVWGAGAPSSLGTSQERPSRRTTTQRTVHRRSYSDPLYEYLKEAPQALHLRQAPRRRRHSGGSALAGNVGMRDSRLPLTLLPDGCELTVGELRDMASRQQQQIESQQQLLVAREQRLKYLKQQESRAAAVAAEGDRLRRLRERVEAQEAKLRRLRALRGQSYHSQVEATRLNTASLTTDLDAMRHLFSEKEKELVVAVSKVEELTRQLEELRHGRSPLNPNNQHHNELDKLRRELLYRNSVNREASARVAAQRETLAARQDEITRIDKRVSELQQRLHRKRLLNHQLASQITAATQAKQAQLKAVQQKALREGVNSETCADDPHNPDHLKIPRGEDLGEFGPNKNDPKYQTLPYNTKFSVTFKSKNGQGGDSDSAPSTPTSTVPPTSLPEPHVSSGQNTAITSGSSNTANSGPPNTVPTSGAPISTLTTSGPVTVTTTSGLLNTIATTGTSNTAPVNGAVVTRTVHSIPTHPPSRGLAHAPALGQSQLSQVSQLVQQQQQSSGPLKPTPNPAMTPRVYGPAVQQFSQRAQPLGGTTSTQNQKLSPGVTTHAQSRTLLLPAHHSQDVENLRAVGNNAGTDGSEDGTSGNETGRNKPALPPKPAVPSKPLPPPRQKGDPLAASNESLNASQSPGRGNGQGRPPQGYRYASQNVIMSTYTQQTTASENQQGDVSEDSSRPKMANNTLNNSTSSTSVGVKAESEGGEKIHVSINRRIEMPPDFMFPEDETPPSDLLGRRVEEIENGNADSQVSSNKENGTDTVDNLNMAPILPLGELEKLRIDNAKEGRNSQDNSTTDAAHIPSDDSRQPDGADTTSILSEESRSEGEGERNNDSPVTTTVSNSNISNNNNINNNNNNNNNSSGGGVVVRRIKKGNLKTKNSSRIPRRVSFDPLALLLDASLEGELELVRRTAMEVTNPSAANDEGITALHNAICAGHLDIVTFLVTFGCDVNAQDSDGWTPLHCAASCNNVAMVRFLVEHGACILATTLSDHETAAEKCEQDEEGYDGCSQYLYSVQEKLGIMNGGVVYGVYDYESQASDELSFHCGDAITILRRGDEYEREWWWGQLQDIQGYIPRNLLGVSIRNRNFKAAMS
ncbi:apoptosis-stimulating of p53 protein 1 isoform X4 [Cherax quadricarinatus]|uniref:apoptosis-stimulating of p53 protein 1 isoform X4 n=1 Tax=Cherax quadricarinatus TaxID=27406 RepID=UPI00387EB76E